MADTVVLIRAEFKNKADPLRLRHYYESVWKALRDVQGYCGSGFWTDVEDPSKALVLYVYRDKAAADDGLKVVAETALLLESQQMTQEPADVMRLKVIEAAGALKDHLTEPDYISLSIRVADPGMEAELQEDLRVVFGESTLLDGFTGYLIAVNDSLGEEVIGLASWNSREAYEASLPKGIPYTVRLFEHRW